MTLAVLESATASLPLVDGWRWVQTYSWVSCMVILVGTDMSVHRCPALDQVFWASFQLGVTGVSFLGHVHGCT